MPPNRSTPPKTQYIPQNTVRHTEQSTSPYNAARHPELASGSVLKGLLLQIPLRNAVAVIIPTATAFTLRSVEPLRALFTRSVNFLYSDLERTTRKPM